MTHPVVDEVRAGVAERVVAVLTHPRRPEALAAARTFVQAMADHGIACLVYEESLRWLADAVPEAQLYVLDTSNHYGAELAVVFGGDGSILRCAEWALGLDLPILGVNLGHVGFLAELESSDIPQLVSQVVRREYTTEKRLCVAVEVRRSDDSPVIWSSFAVNEVSLEKGFRQKMIEVVASVDERPVSRWGCDGILVSTPTGSTAYAFSAGGPVMWPDLEAFLLVPLSAHALFARPLVLAPESVVDLDVLPGSAAMLWCDGRRTFDVPAGARVTVRRLEHTLRMARLSVQPFTSRLVRKFGLRVEGWRGAAEEGR